MGIFLYSKEKSDLRTDTATVEGSNFTLYLFTVQSAHAKGTVRDLCVQTVLKDQTCIHWDFQEMLFV